MSPISSRNILKHELVGLKAIVVKSSNLNHQSIRGVIIDESLKTLVIKSNNEEKMIPKKDATFIFSLPIGQVEVNGAMLYGRPEDRVKKRIKRRW